MKSKTFGVVLIIACALQEKVTGDVSELIYPDSLVNTDYSESQDQNGDLVSLDNRNDIDVNGIPNRLSLDNDDQLDHLKSLPPFPKLQVNNESPDYTILGADDRQNQNQKNDVENFKPYFYNKPDIPFEDSNRQEETFNGYLYPKPQNPFPYPPSPHPPSIPTPSTTEIIDLPDGSARFLDDANE